MSELAPSTNVKVGRTAAAGGAVLSLGAALVGPVAPAGAANFTVTTNADSGDGSLRDAVDDANGAAGADTITFAPGVGTIALTSGEIGITDELTITGPATISGEDDSRIFSISDADEVTLSGLTLRDGNAAAGGAVFSSNTVLTVAQTSITSSDATDGGGGGLFVEDSSPVTIIDSTISGNTATGDGGGVYLHLDDEELVISGSTFDGNDAGGYGGGLSAVHIYDVSIDTTTISGNTADGRGGGADIRAEGGSLEITSSTVSGNTAADGGGGGIRVYGFDYIDIAHTTIADNGATYGGGAFLYDAGEITIDHTLIGDNAADSEPDLGLDDNDSVALSNSLVEAAIGPDTVDDGGGNVLGQDPGLAALADNGGPNQTHALVATSPALDGGDPGFTPPPATDQRGLPRVQGDAIDIGAFETQPEDPEPPPAAPRADPPAARPATANPSFTG